MKKISLLIILITTFNLYTKAQQTPSFATTDKYMSFKLSSSEGNTIDKKGQQLIFHKDKEYDYYMHKRKNRKIIGFSLLGAGFVLGGIGALLATNNNSSNDTGPTAAVSLILSAATGIASIPFMILATVSKNKARAVLEKKTTGYGIPSGKRNIPGITFCLSIGK